MAKDSIKKYITIMEKYDIDSLAALEEALGIYDRLIRRYLNNNMNEVLYGKKAKEQQALKEIIVGDKFNSR